MSTDRMKKLFLSSFAINILVLVLNMGTGILMARFLGPHGRGELAMATRWSALFAGLSTLGLPGAMVYLGKNFKEKQQELFGAFLFVSSAISMVALLICEVAVFFIMARESGGMQLLAQTAMLILPFAVMSDGLIGTLQSFNSFRKVMLLRVLSPLGMMIIILALMAMGQMKVFYIILLNIIWVAGTFAVSLYWIFRMLRPKFVRLYQNAKTLLQYGVKIYAASLVQVFGGNFDQILLSIALSAYALAIYTVASSIGMILPSVLYGTLNVFLAPRLMDLIGEQRRQEVCKFHSIFFYGTLMIAVCGAFTLPFVIPFMYGSEYAPAVLLGIILILCSPLKICTAILSSFFTAEGKFHVISKAELIGVIVGLGSLLVLVRFTGTAGAAWAIAISSGVKLGYLIYHARKLGIPVSKLFQPNLKDSLAVVRSVLRRRRVLAVEKS
jgi:O-antigen/teichoic acid export membrane protein